MDAVNGEMSASRFIEIARACFELGVEQVKFSGGEPLLRGDFEEILEGLPPFRDVSMTTNGSLLPGRAESLASAGLDRVNISLPSLDPARYRRITGRPMLDRVKKGVEAAFEAGLVPVKINTVVLRGVNEDEIPGLMDFTRQFGGDVILQLIELLDFNATGYHLDLQCVEAWLERRAEKVWERRLHRRRKYLVDGVEVEVVQPIDNTEFCGNCTRLRLTPDGKLKPCLLRKDNLVDVKNAIGQELKDLIELAVKRREPYYHA